MNKNRTALLAIMAALAGSGISASLMQAQTSHPSHQSQPRRERNNALEQAQLKRVKRAAKLLNSKGPK